MAQLRSRRNGSGSDSVQNVSAKPYDSVGENGRDFPQLKDPVKPPEDKAGRKLIGIEGNWYDITTFIPKHPGGDIILQYVDKDATDVFHTFHDMSVMKHRRPCGTYKHQPADPATLSYAKLRRFFKENGWFETDYDWLHRKYAVAAAMFVVAWALVLLGPTSAVRYLGGVVLAMFWQQCGFFMHDFMHNSLYHDRVKDQWAGTFFGTVCFGISGSWWRDEHNIHHLFTNTYEREKGAFDVQMFEEVWSQARELFPFFKWKVQRWLISIQHIIFLPILILVGRVGIVVDSMLHERRAVEWLALALHWTWVAALLACLPTWKERLIFYYVASCVQGVLHIQLLVSHYSKPFTELQMSKEIGFFRWQVLTNKNIACPRWMDWFHGGLNFHIEHHLFPRMPRHRLRDASEHIHKVCDEHGIEFDSQGWLAAVAATVEHLKQVSHFVSLDITKY